MREARGALDADMFESANAKLDEALALILAEVQRLSGEEVRTAHEGEIYERRLKAVRAFSALMNAWPARDRAIRPRPRWECWSG